MDDPSYTARVAALDEIWQVWSSLGRTLTAEQWALPTRCPGWSVRAVYAHYSVYPVVLHDPPPVPDDLQDGEPTSAAEILARFNAPDGVANTMAEAVADRAVADAEQHSTTELVDRFLVRGARTIDVLRATDGNLLVPWPGAQVAVTLSEGLRIALVEATVHLLDLRRALDQAPDVPAAALKQTARLIADVAPPVALIEAATGRSEHSPLPVIR